MSQKETKIISFYTQKGGSGKTTLTHIVALALTGAEQGKKVLVLDADSQRSLVKALDDIKLSKGDKNLKPPYELKYAPLTKIESLLRENFYMYDYILIDLPGALDMEGVRTALLACDVVFMPIQPSQLDFTSAKDSIEKLFEIKKYKEKKGGELDFFCMVNQAEPNRLSTKDLIEYIGSTGLPHLESPLLRYEKFKYVLNDYVNILDNQKWGNEEFAFSKIFDEIKSKIK